MVSGFWGALIATGLTCVFLLGAMSAGLVQVVLEKRKHRIINGLVIIALLGGLSVSMYAVMFPNPQKVPEVNNLSRVDIPESLLSSEPPK